jgi:hypothetical protein
MVGEIPKVKKNRTKAKKAVVKPKSNKVQSKREDGKAVHKILRTTGGEVYVL